MHDAHSDRPYDGWWLASTFLALQDGTKMVPICLERARPTTLTLYAASNEQRGIRASSSRMVSLAMAVS